MTRQLVEMTIEANEQVLAKVLDPAQYAMQMPYRIGWTFGLAVMSAGVTVTLLQSGNMDSQQVASQLVASGSAGLSGAMFVTSALTFKSWQFIRQASTRRRETWQEDEAEQWSEPERPEFLPSFVQDKTGYHRVMHDLARREILMLNGHAEQGARFPTRKFLFDKGFTNNAQRFADLRAELHKKGILINDVWTDSGVAWIREEAHLAAPPSPK